MTLRDLLDAGPRRRARRLHRALRQAGDDDPLLAAAFDPGLNARLVPGLPAGFLHHLHSAQHTRDAAGAVRRQAVPLAVPVPGHHVHRLPVGLLPLSDQYLRAVSPRAAPPAVHPAGPARATGVANPLVGEHLRRHHRLVVTCGRGLTPAALVADLLAAFPTDRIAVLCSSYRQVGDVVAQLRAWLVDAAGFYTSAAAGRPAPRVAVGTAAGLASLDARHEGCRVIVVTDPVHFCGPAGTGPRLDPGWVTARWLGVLAADEPLSPLERDRLVCFFGPVRLDVPTAGWVGRRVLFAAQRITLPGGRGYERVVMQLAAAVAGGAGVSDTFGVVRRAGRVGAAGPVVVLAQNHRHRQLLRRVQRDTDRGTVAVATADELSRLTRVGVLVRADRRPPCPPLAEEVLAEPQDDRTPLLVIDAVGAADAELVPVRRRNYRSAGWVPLDAELGGWAEWDAWVHRPPGGRAAG